MLFDDSQMRTRFSPHVLHALFQQRERIKKNISENTPPFMKLPTHPIQQYPKFAKKIRSHSNTLIVIGIGGSSLGTRAIYSLLPADQKFKIIFLFF